MAYTVFRSDLMHGTDSGVDLVSVRVYDASDEPIAVENGAIVELKEYEDGEREVWKGVLASTMSERRTWMSLSTMLAPSAVGTSCAAAICSASQRKALLAALLPPRATPLVSAQTVRSMLPVLVWELRRPLKLPVATPTM